MERITISDINIDIVRKNVKNIHLAVYPPIGRVRIAAPVTINEDAIKLFAISKLAWIKRQQRKFINQERIPQRDYKQRESHYFQGRRYLLNIIETNLLPKVVLRSKTYIDLYVRPQTPTEKRHLIIVEWYRAELKKQIPQMIDKWERIMKVKVDDWQVKLMKTKWGSCNIEEKRIWLNLELAKKSDRCLEYIIVHEMVHLLERNHNERFFAYMNIFLPQWKQYQKELNSFPLSHNTWQY